MTAKTKTYTDEFKADAINMIQIHGMNKTSRDLGVSPVTLRSWRKKLTTNNVSGVESDSELQKEIKRLKKENLYLQKINEVLKKSTAIFSQGEFPPLK